MSMNEELRHKLAIVQMQLKKALEKTEALESVVVETRQEQSRLTKTGVARESSMTGMVRANPSKEVSSSVALRLKVLVTCLLLPVFSASVTTTKVWGLLGLRGWGIAGHSWISSHLLQEEGAIASGDQGPSPRTTSYSKEELQQILQERNELKTNLFLVQEELAYYQRSVSGSPGVGRNTGDGSPGYLQVDSGHGR